MIEGNLILLTKEDLRAEFEFESRINLGMFRVPQEKLEKASLIVYVEDFRFPHRTKVLKDRFNIGNSS